MTLKMTTAQVVETSVTVTNSSFQNYTHPDDHATRTTDTPGFKPFTKFQNHFKKLPIPFVVYADFECFTKPINTCQPNLNNSLTQEYQKHEPSGYCSYLKGLDDININCKQ